MRVGKEVMCPGDGLGKIDATILNDGTYVDYADEECSELAAVVILLVGGGRLVNYFANDWAYLQQSFELH